MRVVGIAGGGEKVAFVRDRLGADAALDYRSEDFPGELAAACPDGVNLFFDLVGGPIADAVSEHLAKRADILLVGRIAANNSATPERDMANLRHVWSREATIHAFNRYAYKELYPEVIERLGSLLRAGRLSMHNHVLDGMEETRRPPCTMPCPGAMSEKCWYVTAIATAIASEDIALDRLRMSSIASAPSAMANHAPAVRDRPSKPGPGPGSAHDHRRQP